MNGKKIVSIVLALSMMLSVITVAHGYSEGDTVPGSLIFFDSFDKKESWNHTNGKGELTIESEQGHEHYMKLVAEEGGPNLLKKSFDGLTAGKSVIEFEVKADNESQNTNKYMYFCDGPNGASSIRLFFANNGKLEAWSGSNNNTVTLAEFTPDEWHKVRMEIDVDAKKYQIYLDDADKGSVDFIGSDALPNIDTIIIRADANTGYLAYDNLVVYKEDGKASAIPTPKVPLPYEIVQRYPTPTPLPTQTPNAKTGKEVVYLDENFETWPEWVTDDSTKANDSEHGNYLKLTDKIKYSFNLPEKVKEGGNIMWEFDFRSNHDGGSGYKSIFISGNGTFVMRIHIGNGGIMNSDVMTTQRLHLSNVKFTEDVWHHVKIHFDSYAKKYEVYIDDQLMYTAAQYDVKVPMQMETLTIERGEKQGYLELDNFKLYDPDGTVQPDAPREVNLLSAKVVDHVFSDMVGQPNSKKVIHFSGHPAEIPVLTLNALGLINGYPDGTFKPDNTITRAEFAAIVARAFKLEDKPVTTEFTDVPSTHWATGNIGAAYAAGIINGYGDGTFGPEDPIKEEQAVKMVVAALGYNDDAVAKGGYPMGYIQVGNEKYISRGLNVHKGEEATRALVAQIMYYALGAEIKGAGKTLYDMHADKAGEKIDEKYVNALLQDYFYYREEAMEVMMYNDIKPLQVFNSMYDVFKNSTNKEERTRAARVLSEFLTADNIEYGWMRYDKVYMMYFYGKLNMLAAGTFARVANDPNEDEDVRLYALRALYLLDREDLVEKDSWTLAFKSKAMTVTRHLSNKAQDILEMTNDEASVNALIKALDDPDVEVVLRAVDTLNRKGSNPTLHEKATAAIPALQKLLNHSNLYIPFRAAEAIRALGGTPEKDVAVNLQPYNNSQQDLKITVDGVVLPDGAPVPENCRIAVVNNGNIEVTFDAGDSGSYGGMKKLSTYDSTKNLLKGSGFVTWNQQSAATENSIKEHNGTKTQGIKAANSEYFEYFYKWDATEMFPYTLELVYRIPKGESGFYQYSIVDKDANSGACSHLYSGIMYRINSEDYPFASIHDKLQYNVQWLKNNVAVETEKGKKDMYQSTYRNQNGELDAKHETYAFQLETHIIGMANDKVGLWQLFPSNDSYAKLLKHDMAAATDTMSAMSEGEYFTWDGRPIPAGEYHKFYGPMMVYVNKGETYLDKWEDAKNKLAYEQEQWPYAWVEDPHYYERGSISGKVEMSDGSSPLGAYVVVNIPGETKGKKGERYTTWQQSNGRYNYWTRADENGNWSIDNVYVDTYTVTVWKEGYPGETQKPDVEIVQGLNTDVGTITFVPYSNGELAWRVGEADRTWLYNAEKNYNWDTHMKYRNRFPNDIVFKIGESDPIYDWNYSHRAACLGEERKIPWTIVWNEDGEITRDPVLTIVTAGSRNTKMEVYVNDTKITTLDYGDDDSMVIRTHAYGKNIYNTLPFDKSLLKPGENKITLLSTGGTDMNGMISYDFIQLEYK